MDKIQSLTICADDYGIAPGVGKAIRALIGQDRLSATSCMTTSAFWPAEAKLLNPVSRDIDVGLHITLTDHRSINSLPSLAPNGTFPSVGALFKRALLHKLDRADVFREINGQIDAFVSEMNRLPDFLDGHHHVHQFPVIRDAVIAIWQDRFPGRHTWIRSCHEPLSACVARGIAVPKCISLSTIGRPLKRALVRNAIPHNESFLGIYDLNRRQPFQPIVRRYLRGLRGRSLLMCHPGFVDNPLIQADRLTYQREVEFEYLGSEAFLQDLQNHHVSLSKTLT